MSRVDASLHQPDALDPLHLILKETARGQQETLTSLLDSSLLATDPSKLDPLAALMQELSECCYEEHEMAAQVLVSRADTMQALKTIHTALRRTGMDENGVAFNPLKEYVNVALPGIPGKAVTNQQLVISMADSVDFDHPGLLQAVFNTAGKRALQLIRTVRWEWQVGGAPRLRAEERELLESIAVIVSKFESSCTE